MWSVLLLGTSVLHLVPAASPRSLGDNDDYYGRSLDTELEEALRQCVMHYSQAAGRPLTAPTHRNSTLRPSQGRRQRRRCPEPPSGSAGGRHRQRRARTPRSSIRDRSSVPVCAIHCALAKAQLVTPGGPSGGPSGGFPAEALLVKRLEDSIASPPRRVAAMREARVCFSRLGAGSAAEDDPCWYSIKLAECTGMSIVREYYRIQRNSNG